MADIRSIRRRVHDIQMIAKMTNAMAMIATAKMGRSRRTTLASWPYAGNIRDIVADLASRIQDDEKLPPLLQSRLVERIGIVHITPDRGLCGGLDANINRVTTRFLERQSLPVSLILVGRKGIDFMRHVGVEIRAEFTHLGDRPSLADTLLISHTIIDDYTEGKLDAVYLVYAKFTSAAMQRPVLEQILPVERSPLGEGEILDIYQPIYEPSPDVVLAELAPRLMEIEVYHAILESIASEQSSRSLAMHNATNNAEDLIDELTLEYNKARQESITRGLLDITRGSLGPMGRRSQ